MKEFLIAFQFLTAFPVKLKSAVNKRDFAAALMWFPVVGMLIGLSLALIFLLSRELSNLVSAALVLIGSIILTGALHLDGFADTCDGFYGHIPKTRRLEIMRDPHLGAMGTIGIVMILLFKFSLIAALAQKLFWQPLVAMTVFGRYSQVLACFLSRCARKTGKGRFFIEYAGEREIVITSIFTLLLLALLMQAAGVIVFFLSIVCVLPIIKFLNRKINGATGDTIGAINELAEVFILIFFVMLAIPNR